MSIHPEDREQIIEKGEISDRTGCRFLEEYRMIRRDGRIVWVKEDTNLIRDKEGDPLYWQGILLDITKEKENEAALQWQLKELAVLHSASLAASNALQFDELIEQVTDVIGNMLYPDNVGILLLDANAWLSQTTSILSRHKLRKNFRNLCPSLKALPGKLPGRQNRFGWQM